MTAFRLAIYRPGRDGADFVTIKTWERLAEATAEHLARGHRVAVQGWLAHEEWIGSDGRRAERLTVVADRVEFLDAPAAAKQLAGGEEECEDSSIAPGPGFSWGAFRPRAGRESDEARDPQRESRHSVSPGQAGIPGYVTAPADTGRNGGIGLQNR